MTEAASSPAGPGAREGRFWLAALLAAAFVSVAWQAGQGFLPEVDLGAVDKVFLPGAAESALPEPGEFAFFTLVTFGFPVAILACFAGLGALERRAPGSLQRLGPGVQALVVVILALHWLNQPFFGPWAVGVAGVASLVAVAALRPLAGWWTGGGVGGRAALACRAAALVLIVWRLLPALHTDTSLPHADPVVQFHFPYQAGEFTAPLAGEYPLGGFIAQYVNILSVLAIPLFRATGFGVLSFTGLMVALSGLGLACVYAGLARAFPENGRALLVFVLYLGMACFVMEDGQPDRAWYNVYSYYAMGPMRMLGPQILFWMVAVRATAGAGARRWPLAVVAAFVAVNNLDFGMPAWIAALAAAVVIDVHGTSVARWGGPVVRSLAVFAAMTGAAALAWGGVVQHLSGAPPDPFVALAFQEIFAVHGFYSLPMPARGLHVIVLITHLLVFSLVVLDLARGRLFSRTAAALLLFNAVYAVGTFAYYVGRSHEQVLVTTFGPWALTLLITIGALMRSAPPGALSPRGVSLRPVAAAALFLVTCMGTRALELPLPWEQARRLLTAQPGLPFTALVHARAAFVRDRLPDGEATVVVSANSHWISNEAGARNRFPFNHGGSLVTFAQVDLVLGDIEREDIGHVFGILPDAMAEGLRARGFATKGAIGNFVHYARALPRE